MTYTNEGLPAYIEVDTQHQGAVLPSKGNVLGEVYGTYSAAKAAAYARCVRICEELNGHQLCITSANTCFFTAQFEFSNPVNARPMVCRITPSRTYAMYTDTRFLCNAREAWHDYADMCAHTGVVYQWRSSIGPAHVVWVGSHAYIGYLGELYRVAKPMTKNGKIRKRVVLHRVGVINGETADMLLQDGHALCGVNAVCDVKLSTGDTYAVVRVSYVDDAMDATDAEDVGTECVVTCLRERYMMVAAACVDACSLEHGYDGHGAPVRLWA